MALYVSLLTALLVLACGSDQRAERERQEAAEAQKNQAPVIRSLTLHPSSPTSSQPLSASVRTHDPEAGPLRIQYSWYRNGRVLSQGPRNTLPASGLSRGDRVYVVVSVSDGELESSETSPVIRIRNAAPQVLSVDVTPKRPTAKEPIRAVVQMFDADGDDVELEYRWYVNDKQVPDVTSDILEAGIARREDQVAVSAAGHDETERGEWFRSRTIKVWNSAPQISSRPTYKLSGDNTYEYTVEASDPDDDGPLRYTLDKGPPGMKIDRVSGRVSWKVPTDAGGEYPVELSVSDAHGGTSRQTYLLELHWETVPANPR